MNNSKDDYLNLIRALSGQANILTIPRLYIEMLGGEHIAALLLSQCIYWSDRTKRADGFFYKSDSEWKEELCISRFQLKRALNVLGGLIETKLKKANGAPTTHYRVNGERLTAAIKEYFEIGYIRNLQMEETNKTDIKETRKSVLRETNKSLTLNYAKTTTLNQSAAAEKNAAGAQPAYFVFDEIAPFTQEDFEKIAEHFAGRKFDFDTITMESYHKLAKPAARFLDEKAKEQLGLAGRLSTFLAMRQGEKTNAKRSDFEKELVDILNRYPPDVVDVIKAFSNLWRTLPPTGKAKSYWIQSAQEIIKDCGAQAAKGYLSAIYTEWNKAVNKGDTALYISDIGSVVKMCRAKHLAKLAEGKTVIDEKPNAAEYEKDLALRKEKAAKALKKE